ncbi:T9SS type A sorting domain-containing protein [Taibaiella koreensis]|uniref:T9SS type A sorting domain-containing protein n=1 Tax=Taibaiella koreensis TaxID=1268548 RepID=UPI000E59F9DC|nr:T9SS type A sorting domain-containing protein [Taibaiella koreensis]
MNKTLMLMVAATLFAGAVTAQDTLSGNITVNRVLTSNRCYYLRGCVTVKSGVTLAIQPGTKIFGLAPLSPSQLSTAGALIIERGAKINAAGTSSAPIVFTSSKPAGSRARGDWAGIILAGKAPINVPGGTYQVEGACVPVLAGGTDVADNSGVMTFVQIHYAGIAFSPDNEINSLTLAGVGNGTRIENIQVTNANDDAFEFFGGTVNAKNLIALDTRDDDFDTDLGYNGKIQFGLSIRKDTTSHDISGSNGIESDNNNVSPDYLGTPKTRAIFSNFTFIGPKYCNPGITLNAEYDNGALIRRNSAHSLYNSIETSWPDNGLFVKDAPTVVNTSLTSGDMLNYSFNSLYDNGTNFTGSTWTGGCGASILVWANVGNIGTGCLESGNQTPVGVPAFTNAASIKGNYCQINPNFAQAIMLDTADFTGSDLTSGFTVVKYRGAFGTTDWTAGWTTWCPQNQMFSCGSGFAALAKQAPVVRFAPNPASNTTHAIFEANQLGNAQINVIDQISGQVLKVVNTNIIDLGEQNVTLDINGLKAGTYLVTVRLKDGSTINGQLVVL